MVQSRNYRFGMLYVSGEEHVGIDTRACTAQHFFRALRPLPWARKVNEGAHVDPARDPPVELGRHVIGIAVHGPDVRSRYGEGARRHHGVEALLERGVIVGIEIHQHLMRERGAARASGRARTKTRAGKFVACQRIDGPARRTGSRTRGRASLCPPSTPAARTVR